MLVLNYEQAELRVVVEEMADHSRNQPALPAHQ